MSNDNPPDDWALSPIVLSASSVTTYLRCGAQWEMAYVLGWREPPSLRQAIGIAGHKAVEANMSQKIASRTDLAVSDVLDAYSDAFNLLAPEIVPDGRETLRAGKESGIRAVTAYHTAAAPLIQPIEVEKSFQFALNGIPYNGQMDLIDDDGTIRDTKFVGRTPAPGKYDLQLTGYELGYRQATGSVEAGATIDVIVRKTKPEYVPISSPPATDDEIRRFATVIEHVEAGIRAGSFPPNGLAHPGTCDWCGFKSACPARTRSS